MNKRVVVRSRPALWVVFTCGAVALSAGCRAHQHSFAASSDDVPQSLKCSECGGEWLSPSVNQQDNGYGSKHYFTSRQSLAVSGKSGQLDPAEALGRLQELDGSRQAFWTYTPPSVMQREKWWRK